jgi:hypothetical protein
VNPRTNNVDVGVADNLDAARLLLHARYGDDVSVALEPLTTGQLLCTEDDCGTKGGLVIDHNSPNAGCTSGFLSRAKQGSSGSWNGYIYTAGHCIDAAGGVGNTNNWHNGAGTTTWGRNKAEPEIWYECGFFTLCLDMDQGLVGLGTAVPSQWNRYFIGGGSTVAINARTFNMNQLIGQVVNRYGRTSGLDAGTINDKPEYFATSVGGYTHLQYNVIKVGMASNYGDSGAGYYRLYTSSGTTYRSAYGSLSSGPYPGSSPTYYTPWDVHLDGKGGNGEAWARWYIEPCITVGCGL